MCDACKEMLSDVPAKDWKLTKVEDRGPSNYYRYHVEGENLNWPVGHRQRSFSWCVPSIDNPRYDATGAKFILLAMNHAAPLL